MPERYTKRLFELKEKYEAALKQASVEEAMQYGEAYFITLRNGELTEEDREKLQNDIFLMCQNRDSYAAPE